MTSQERSIRNYVLFSGKPFTVKDIAKETGQKPKYVYKILRKLKAAGKVKEIMKQVRLHNTKIFIGTDGKECFEDRYCKAINMLKVKLEDVYNTMCNFTGKYPFRIAIRSNLSQTGFVNNFRVLLKHGFIEQKQNGYYKAVAGKNVEQLAIDLTLNRYVYGKRNKKTS